jgi:multidrug transporter EmrE-like cation transporter
MTETTRAILVTLLFSGIGVLGDYFLKLASEQESSLRSGWFFLGFAVYSSTAFGWLFVMKHLKLSTIGVVYSVTMIVLLTTVGTVFFNERLALPEILGVAMGVGALLLLARFA